jgi:xanthine dehydrogenase large subunit
MPFTFTLNGKLVEIDGVAPTTTLLDWLRSTGMTGSKQGCAEGDCGACTVAIVDRDSAGKTTYRAINSCIALLPMVAGREVITVEGLTRDGALHPVQEAMVGHFGSQCGYCTPGFCVSMFEGYYRKDCTSHETIADQLCGNLCRCTGYRPIRDAAVAAYAMRDVGSALAPTSAGDPFATRLAEPVATPGLLEYHAAGQSFFRPDSLELLFALRQRHPEARLVDGATEVGVDITKKFAAFPVLISTEGIAELTAIRVEPDAIHVGASATLTNVEEAIAGKFPSIAKMLRLFASRQIRNRATLGGNLVTASPIGDSAPVLLTLDAIVELAAPGSARRKIALADFFTGYRKTAMRPDEVMTTVVIPRGVAAGLTRKVEFLKVSKRRELDISIVAGAFRMDVDAAGVVREARIAYGGVAERPKRALKAEAAATGRTLAESKADVLAALGGEFTPIDDARGTAEYRRLLVTGLWESFVASEAGQTAPGSFDFVEAPPPRESDATRALRHESAVGHVTGGAMYVDDTAQRRRTLDVWPICSKHAHARITRRDATVASKMPGVVAVLLAEDIPGGNNVGVSRHDEPLFAEDLVQYHGQMIGVVIGESVAACREAAAKVEVDYEPLPPVLTIASAIAANSYHTDPHVLKRGDCNAALAGAPHRFEGEFTYGGQDHFYLETHAAWAEAGEGGAVTIHSSTQHPSEIQTIVSEVLGCARNMIVVEAPRMGGGFGGKETQGNAFGAIVALATLRTGRPVRLQLDRDLDMVLTGKRHPFHAKFSVGHDADGRVLAVKAEVVSDGGWSLDLSQPVLDRALFHIDNTYFLPAAYFSGRVAKTNTVSHTAFRGFGGPQGIMIIEEIMDRVARRTGLAPEVVRERNLYHGTGETNTTHYGEEIGDNRIQELWKRALEQGEFSKRRAEIDAWNHTHSMRRRGLAITGVKFGISFTLAHYNQAGALVNLYQDGTAQVNHGGTEMGQGLHTKVLGVAMRELGLRRDQIRMMTTSTDKVPNTSATAASSGADLNGAAVADACRTLRARLAPVAARMLGDREAESGVKPYPQQDEIRFDDGFVFAPSRPERLIPIADVCRQAYTERVQLSATGYYATPNIKWDWAKAEGHPFHYFACGAAVAEVEVDGYTGMHRVLRVDIVHDVGDSLNPGVDRGQIEGGFVQGMGWLTREELLWDKEGKLLTHSASTYQIPAFSDAPVEFNVTLLPKATQPNTIHGSKAVGEPPLMLAFSVREAIRDAVASFGGTGGEVPLASPATGEAILRAIQERLGRRAGL